MFRVECALGVFGVCSGYCGLVSVQDSVLCWSLLYVQGSVF